MADVSVLKTDDPLLEHVFRRGFDRQMFYDILGNHEGRLRGLEGASGRSA